MKRINNYDELNQLITSNFKKGVFTNCFIGKEEFEKYIQQNRLFYSLYDGGLLIFIKNQGFFNMKFYIHNLNVKLQLPVFKKVVVEVAGKAEKDLGMIEKHLENVGLRCILKRLRFSCGDAVINNNLSCDKLTKVNLKDSQKIIKILRKNYDKYTGCIPSKEDIKMDIENGNFCCYKEGKKILGILHIRNNGSKTEMRHLAVLKKNRGKNIAKCLITRYLMDVKEKQKQVWTSTENEIAKKLFEGFGYKADGYVSKVWVSYRTK